LLTNLRKLIVALSGLVILGVLVSGVAADRSLRSDQLEQVERSLEERARLVLDQTREISFEHDDRATLDALADRTARAGMMRVTLISLDGTVLGDSGVDLDRLPGIESHADRPEVRAALAGEVGSATRRSDTVGHELLYLALPAEGRGIVRVAVTLSELDAARAALRRRLAVAGCVGLLIAIALSFLIARSALRPIQEVRRVAEAIARGDLDERPPLSGGDALGEISNSIREIARQLRTRLEDATHEKEQLRAVLESMVEGVLVVDAAGRVLLANSRLREFYGIRNEITGHPLLEVIRHPELDVLLRDVAEADAIVSSTFTLGDPPRTLRVQAARFPRGVEPRAGSVAVFHDISELERLEEVRRDFVANASHELRTPLTAIQGFAETLLEADLSPDKRQSYLEIIDRHARRLGFIVRDLLALSTVETGKWRVEPMQVDVADIARTVIHDLEPRVVEGELSLDCEVEGDVEAFADPRILEQILTNLLDNAVKYTEPGGRVEVRLIEGPERVRLIVRDTGIGIPEEDQSRIFERFYRVDKARSRSAGGTGLGLSIVRHLVQRLGGEISVESRVGEGTTFAFSLPKRGESA
jgi:two-component system, OmpR family, phosphate regulon sensor histidine kinase PhoR